MFIGEYTHTIDSKKRLAVPSKFRRELGQRAIVTRGVDQCLVIYPEKEWKKIAERLGSLPASQGEARSFARMMLSGAMDVRIDNLGRILVPDYLKEYASLKKSVVLIGLYNRVEIWDEKKWREYKKKTEVSVPDIAGKLKDLGI